MIGNAPTALFHLIDAIAAGGRGRLPSSRAGRLRRRSGIEGGAGGERLGVPWLVVDGRLGGSAIASAAVNALASDRL